MCEVDIHQRNAARIFGVPEHMVTPAMRHHAKRCLYSGVACEYDPYAVVDVVRMAAHSMYGLTWELPTQAQMAKAAESLGVAWPPQNPIPQPTVKGVHEVPQGTTDLPHAKYTPPPSAEGTVTITLTETQARQLLAVCAYNSSVARVVAERAGMWEGPASDTILHYRSGLLTTNLGLVHTSLKEALPEKRLP